MSLICHVCWSLTANASCLGRELSLTALISPALAEGTKVIPPCGGKVVFLPESLWK